MDFDLMISSFPKLLNATLVTLKLVSLSLIFGIFLGTFFAILRTGKNKFLKNFSYYYSYVFRGTPMLVQLFIIYFGLAQIEYLRSSFLLGYLKRTLLVCYNCFCFKYWCLYIGNFKICIRNN